MPSEFFQTRMGVRFFEHDVPETIRQLAKLNENLAALVVKDARVVELARKIATLWRDQDGVNGALLDQLADLVRGPR